MNGSPIGPGTDAGIVEREQRQAALLLASAADAIDAAARALTRSAAAVERLTHNPICSSYDGNRCAVWPEATMKQVAKFAGDVADTGQNVREWSGWLTTGARR